MIENLVDFALNVVAGAVILFCLFDGTRRLGAHGFHRKALLLVLLSTGGCALYGVFAYQRYTDLKGTLSASQRKPAPAQAVVSISKRGTPPEKREQLSQALARQNFRVSGRLESYADRNGETKTFAPNQEDMLARERMVAYYARAEVTARGSLAEALLWPIAAIVAIFFGLFMSLDKPPAPKAGDAAAVEA